MMKPKEALVKDGFLPAGSENTRGRLSGAAIARCKELVALGWDIEGYANSSTPNSTPTAATVERVKVETGVKTIADIGPALRDETALIARFQGKTIGMRDVCAQCGNSFTYCPCTNPVKWIDSDTVGAVTFHPRPANAPQPNKFW